MVDPARTTAQRKADTLARLERDVDAWVATADHDTALPRLVPLSFWWDGTAVVIGTPMGSPTGRNLLAGGTVRLGIGPSRDVVLIDGTATAIPAAEIPTADGDAFAGKAEFDPREEPEPYAYFRIVPQRIQAWRESNELAGRVLMRDGRWVDRSEEA
jgi:hypothetical protein